MKNAQLLKNVCKASSLIAAVVLAASSAHAVTLTNTNAANLESSRTIQFGTSTATTSTLGAWRVNVGNSNVDTANSFWVYCLDPLTGYNNPNVNVGTMNLSSWVTGNANPGSYTSLFATTPYQAASVVNKYDNANTTTANVLNKLTALYEHAYKDSLVASKSDAFQYAIWEIEGESSYDYNAGGLKYTGATQSFKDQAKAYLDALNSGNWSNVNGKNLTATTLYDFTVYIPDANTGGQVVMSVKEKTGNNNVPEPGSLGLAALALFGLAFTRRQTSSKR